MIIFVLVPLSGLLAGYLIRRWSLVAAVVVIGLAASLSGWLTGWAASPDTPAVGGAILLAGYIWIPLGLSAAIGVYLGRYRRRP
jgi:hypothetical protein